MTSHMISESAVQRGFGTDLYKHVCFLTAEEKAFARAGGRVYFASSALSGGNNGTYWRYALPIPGGRFAPRVPSAEEIALLDA